MILPIDPGIHSFLKKYFKGLCNLKPPQAKYETTWDPQLVLDYLEGYFPLEKLTLKDLTLKLVTLIALTTAHRVQTISKISLDNIKRYDDRIEIKITERVKTTSRTNILPLLVLPFCKENEKICVATTLLRYIKVTKNLRGHNEKRLFITHLKPHRPPHKETLSKWIKSILELSGVDTNIFSAHSTRHAATSAASRSGVNIESIRKAAGWSKGSNTFNKHYNRPLTEFANAVTNKNK